MFMPQDPLCTRSRDQGCMLECQCPLRWASSHRQCQQTPPFLCLSLQVYKQVLQGREHPVFFLPTTSRQPGPDFCQNTCWDEGLECCVLENTESTSKSSMDRLTYFIPCWKTEFLRVLQMIKSAHCTTTMLTKKAVWQVNSTIFLCS